MKSTGLADLFYRLDINPFYVIAPLVFFVPIGMFLLCIWFFDHLYSLGITLLIFLFCSVIFYLYFHRDPKREIAFDENALLSPADGQVVYVKEIQKGEIIESVKKRNRMKLAELLDVTNDNVQTNAVNGFIIGIELRLFDVHITRAPVTGTKILDHHVSGKIVSMNNPLFEYINDRETVVLAQHNENAGSSVPIAVVQIATFITRTVKSFVREKTQIQQGERIGMIRLGSQVDVVIFSPDVTILVKERDRVYAGITKIAEHSNL
jgi:phosphatidylserine decarboxylase